MLRELQSYVKVTVNANVKYNVNANVKIAVQNTLLISAKVIEMETTFKDKVNKNKGENQIGKEQKPKFPNIDIHSLLSRANTPYTIINQLPMLDFKKVGKKHVCLQSSGLQVYKKKSENSRFSGGDWYIKNNSDKLNVPNGDIWDFTRRLHNIDTKGKGNQEGFYKVCCSVAKAAYLDIDGFANGLKENINYQPETPKISIDWIVNNGQALEIKYSYQTVGYESDIGAAVIAYFSTWGISIETLKKYRIEPLKEATNLINEFGYTRRFSTKNIAFTHNISDDRTIKAKCPNVKNKAHKYFNIQYKGNYCFGYNQLPKTGKYLIIVAGEKDALLINEHFNIYDMYAICFGSESATIDKKFLNELRGRFEKIYTCFDNDKAGAINMEKQALKHGIPYININEHTKCNDLADIYEKEGLEALELIFISEILHKTAIAKRENDSFSVGVGNAYKLDIQRYIGEKEDNEDTKKSPLETLKAYIEIEDKILLDAPTGMGKTWGLMYVTQDANFVEDTGIKRIIFCVPTKPIGEQLKEDFKKEFKADIPFIKGDSTDDDIDGAYRNKTVITTYDSIQKAIFSISETLLIVDEMHELRNAGNYRKGAVQTVFEYMNLAKKVIAVSATPLYQFCMNTDEKFGYKLVKVFPKNRQEIIIQPYVYSKGVEAFVLKHRLLSINHEKSYGVHIFKKNDVNMLEACTKTIEYEYGEDSVTILSSKKAEYRADNKHYQSIIKNGKVDDSVRFIFTTSLMDTGTSFKFQVDSCTLINPSCQDALIQFLARARYREKDESIGVYEAINKTVYGHCYHTKGKPKKIAVRQHIDTEKAIKELINIALDDIEKANNHTSNNVTYQSKYMDDLKHIYYSDIQGKWAVDYLSILLDEYTRQKEVDTIEDFYSRITHYQPHIKVLSIKKVDLLEDIRTHNELSNKKRITKEQREAALNYVVECAKEGKEELNTALTAAYYCVDRGVQKIISKSLENQLPKRPTSEINCHIIENQEYFLSGAIQKPVSRLVEAKTLGENEGVIPKILNMSNKEYMIYKNSMVAIRELERYYEDKSKVDGKELARVQRYEKLIDKVRKTNSKRRIYTADQWTKVVQKAYGDDNVKKDRALSRMRELFVVDIIKKRIRVNGRRPQVIYYKIVGFMFKPSKKAK